DTFTSDGSRPFSMDPRNALKRCKEHLISMGYKRAHLQPELEFYLFKEDSDIEDMVGERSILDIQPKKGYFASIPLDNTDAFRNEFTSNLLKAGLDIKFHHHEGGADQVEIEFKHVPDIIECADAAMLYKLLSRLTAREFGYFVSYMPKISDVDSGNGMHIHAWLEGENGSAFVDQRKDMELSKTALHFIGGILSHARATCIVTNPTINSYKRLIPQFEAPVYASWGYRNRTTMVRIPGSPGSRRVGDIEIRHADTSCNPYLAFTVLIQAGLDGIEKGIEPPAPLDTDPNKLSEGQKKEQGVELLPSSLSEAVDAALSDDIVRLSLGSELFDALIERKSREAVEYRKHVGEWEISRYLSL
ncbi:MAG: glutamine synthetase, partial [Candidatus Thermoplasmatota archaeon]|nr:glutamine synthetase [Candidatus Thermoplasmatota archaeon]